MISAGSRAGEEVTITATPDEGYEVEAVTVTDRDGEEINVTEAGDGVYTFEMPDSPCDHRGHLRPRGGGA